MSDLVSESNALLEPDFLRKLERLSLVVRRVFAGRMQGERRSSKRGASVEFADYRNYVMGDDFRRVDWNVYARLERLFLKLFIEEEDLSVHFLLDASESMKFGQPPKLLQAKRICAALAYAALSNHERVQIVCACNGTSAALRPMRGKHRASEMLEWLSGIEGGNEASIGGLAKRFALETRRPGLAVVISDFFDPERESGIMALLSRRFEVVVIQVLDDEELRPSLVGDLRLVDSETGEAKEVTIGATLLRRYDQAMSEFCNSLEQFCRGRGANYLRAANSEPFEDLVLSYMRRRGILG